MGKFNLMEWNFDLRYALFSFYIILMVGSTWVIVARVWSGAVGAK